MGRTLRPEDSIRPDYFMKQQTLTYITQQLNAVLYLVNAPRIQEVFHSDRLCSVDTSSFDPVLKPIQVQWLILFAFAMFFSMTIPISHVGGLSRPFGEY